MSTGWTISIGYNSHASGDGADLWAALKASAEKWRHAHEIIDMEAEKFNAPDKCDGEWRLAYSEVYAKDWADGGPLHVSEERHCLLIRASGGGCSRDMKEHVARAFCRLIINDMHHQGIEVNLTVS